MKLFLSFLALGSFGIGTLSQEKLTPTHRISTSEYDCERTIRNNRKLVEYPVDRAPLSESLSTLSKEWNSCIKNNDQTTQIKLSLFNQNLPATAGIQAGANFDANTFSNTPPNTNAAVGKTQIVQYTSGTIGIYDKSGTELETQLPIGLLFSYYSVCRTPKGDGVIVYDQFRDRFVLSFVGVDEMDERAMTCFAVTQTGDATGSWYL